jgi:ferrous iron transport protein B
MYLMFMFTINIGGAFVDLFDGVAGAIFVDGGRAVLDALGAPEWLVVLLADGVGGGIQVVATFIPIIGALYLFLSVLEDSGYLARAAFVMDRTMRRIGLPGKAFVPMIVGFGCNVPAVMATRTLEHRTRAQADDPHEPVHVVRRAAAGLCPVRRGVLPEQRPEPRVPAVSHRDRRRRRHGTGDAPQPAAGGRPRGSSWRCPPITGRHCGTRCCTPGIGCGSSCAAPAPSSSRWSRCSPWSTRSAPTGAFGNEDSENSVLSAAGRTITPVFAPMGLDEDNWPATVGIFTGVLAKEAVVGTLDSLYGTLRRRRTAQRATSRSSSGTRSATHWRRCRGTSRTPSATVTDPLGIGASDVGRASPRLPPSTDVDTGVYGAMQSRFDGRAGAFAYLLFVLLYFPCVAVIGAIVREAGRRWALFVAAWTTGIAYVVATAFYQAATLPDHPGASIAWLGTLGVAVVVAFVLLRRWGNRRPAPAAVPVHVRPRRADAPAQD